MVSQAAECFTGRLALVTRLCACDNEIGRGHLTFTARELHE
jgi:hypothetical protein